MAIGVQNFQILSPEQANPYGHSLSQALAARLNQMQAQKLKEQMPYFGPQAEADLNKSNLFNQMYIPDIQSQIGLRNNQSALAGQEAKYYGPKTESEIGYQGAQSGLANTQTQLNKLKIKYPGLGEGGIVGQLAFANLVADHPEIGTRLNASNQQPVAPAGMQGQPNQQPQQPQQAPPAVGDMPQPQAQQPAQQPTPLAQGIAQTAGQQAPPINPVGMLLNNIQSDTNSKNSLANMRAMGGRAGVGAQQHMQLQNYIAKEHPDFTPEQLYAAANTYLEGSDTMPDGTKLPPPHGLIRSTLDQIGKTGTTAALVTSGVRGNQADAEINVLSKRAQEGLKPYGTTYFGKSPDQIADTFRSDPESQKRLGKFIASQQLQYELAQNEIKLANGQPGVTSTEELMKLGQQMVDAKYPRLSGVARAEAQKYFIESLQEALKARNAVSIGASSLKGEKNKGENQESSEPSSQENVTSWKRVNGQLVRG